MVRKYIDEISYDVVTSNTTVRSMDYNIEQNEIYVEDDLFGIINLQKDIPYLDVVKRLDYT